MANATEIFFDYHVNDGRWKGVFERHFDEFPKNHQLGLEYRVNSGTAEQLFSEKEFRDFDVAFFIISKDYLSIPMVENGNFEEAILNLERNGTKVVLVHAEYCEWQIYPWMQKYLKPGYSNAFADDWGYQERLDRLVSDLIKDVMAEKRGTDHNTPLNTPSVKVSHETPEENDDRRSKFEKVKNLMPELLEEMENDFTSKGSDLVREFVVLPNKKVLFPSSKKRFYYYLDEHEDLYNKIDLLVSHGYVTDVAIGNTPIYRISEEFFELLKSIKPRVSPSENWRKDFIRFLAEDKGWSVIDNSIDKVIEFDLSIRHPVSRELIAVFNCKEKIDRKLESKVKASFARFNELELGKFLVTPSNKKTNYSFTIYKYSDQALIRMPYSEFPAYKQKYAPNPDIAGLQAAFEEFLVNVKHYPKGTYTFKEKNELLLFGSSKKLEALIKFTITNDRKRLGKIARNFYSQTSRGKENFLICPAPGDSFDYFEILRVEENGYETVLKEDFLAYEEGEPETPDKKVNLFKFRGGVDIEGSQICDKIIDLVGDSNIGLYAEDVNESYANLRVTGLKKTDNVAVQIHKCGEYENQIALAVVGPMKGVKVSEPKLNDFIDKGKITELSGYKKNIPGEKAWLNGNLPKKGTREKSTVYVIQGEIVNLPEQLNALGEILNLGVENIKKSPPEKPGKAKIIGHVATMADDKASVKDLLGRAGLVESLANMFVHNKEMEGFTVALFGNWGEGKSTIMNLLKDRLNEKKPGDFDFATFNAWEYEHTKNIAAGLAQEVVKGLREKNFFKKQWQRIRFAWKENKLSVLTLAGFIISPFLLYFLRQHYNPALLTDYFNKNPNFKELLDSLIKVAYVVLPLFGIGIFKKKTEHPLDIKLQTYFKLPDYGEHLGLIPVLKKHIEILCQLKLGENRKLVLFVDDLDRCQRTCIAETLDAIRLVTAVQRVNVFICIDHRIAFKAIGEHYQKVGDGKGGRPAREIARDYLGKIIQLPIRLQEPTVQELEGFIDGRLFPDIDDAGEAPKKTKTAVAGIIASVTGGLFVDVIDKDDSGETSDHDESETVSGTPSGADQQQETDGTEIEELTEEEMQDTKDERDEFYDMAKMFRFSNPRQLLRLRNCYRLIKALELQKAHKEKRALGFEQLQGFMRMLFWQEFLHNRPKDLREACVEALYGDIDAKTISDEQTKDIVGQAKGLMVGSFTDKKIYDEMAEKVRIVVLPHSQED